MRRFLIFITLIFGFGFTGSAWAQITITDVDYASAFLKDDNGTVTNILGGILGDQTTSSCTGAGKEYTLCNTCLFQNLACNPVRIHDGLILRISFVVTGEITGQVAVGTNDGSWLALNLVASTSGTLEKDDTGFADINWVDICFRINGATCDLIGGEIPLVIGLSPLPTTEPVSGNFITVPVKVVTPDGSGVDGYELLDCADAGPSTGVCNFLAYPGDEKISIDDLQEVGTWPLSTNNVRIKALRVFHSTVSFADANYDSPNYTDFDLDDQGVPLDDKVEGLTNDVPHFFRPAAVDDANNVAFLVDEAEINLDGDCAGALDLGCDLIATPSKVVGLLNEDLNCFVSTVAYGSSLAPEVQTFRKFRNKFLLRSQTGKFFNKLYYKYGPYAARFISKNSFLKPVVRTALWPVAYLADQSNRQGIHIFILGLLGFGIMFGSIIIGGRQLWRRIS